MEKKIKHQPSHCGSADAGRRTNIAGSGDERQKQCCDRRVQLKCDGTGWHMGGETKGKLTNGVGSQYPSHHRSFQVPPNLVHPALLPLMPTPQLPGVDWTDAPADLNGLVLFAERRNLVSAHVPSLFKRSLPRTGKSTDRLQQVYHTDATHHKTELSVKMTTRSFGVKHEQLKRGEQPYSAAGYFRLFSHNYVLRGHVLYILGIVGNPVVCVMCSLP